MTFNDPQDPASGSLRPYEHVLFTDLDGVEGVLVDLNTKKYYQLNETASLVWRGIEQGLTINEIARRMTEAYEVTIEHATASVETALRSMVAQKLIRPH